MGLKIFFGEEGGGGGGRGGGRLEELTFKILKAFLFYYCAHSANINQNCNSRGGGGSFAYRCIFTVHRQRCQDLVVCLGGRIFDGHPYRFYLRVRFCQHKNSGGGSE